MSMPDYLKEIKSVCEQLYSIRNHVSEKMKIFAALHGLGREYEPIKTSIEGYMDTYPSPTFEDVITRLNGYADRLTRYETENSRTLHLAFNTVQTTSNPTYQSNRGRGYSYQRNGGRNRGFFSTKGHGFH